MEPSKAVKEYKEELIKVQAQNERLTTLVGKVTVEKEWLAKKLKSLGSSNRKQLVGLKPCSLHTSPPLSVNQQCQLLGVNRSGLYYKPSVNHTKQTIKSTVTNFEDLVLSTLIMYGVQTLPISKLQTVWFIWLPLLIGTAKRCYRTEYLTPWIPSW